MLLVNQFWECTCVLNLIAHDDRGSSKSFFFFCANHERESSKSFVVNIHHDRESSKFVVGAHHDSGNCEDLESCTSFLLLVSLVSSSSVSLELQAGILCS